MTEEQMGGTVPEPEASASSADQLAQQSVATVAVADEPAATTTPDVTATTATTEDAATPTDRTTDGAAGADGATDTDGAAVADAVTRHQRRRRCRRP